MGHHLWEEDVGSTTPAEGIQLVSVGMQQGFRVQDIGYGIQQILGPHTSCPEPKYTEYGPRKNTWELCEKMYRAHVFRSSRLKIATQRTTQTA